MLYDPNWKPVAPVEPKEETVESILLKAAALIEEKGWCRNYQWHGRHCVVGAINHVMGITITHPSGMWTTDLYYAPRDHKNFELRAEVMRHLRLHIARTTWFFNSIEAWNDEQKGSSKVVGPKIVQMLRDAAKGE